MQSKLPSRDTAYSSYVFSNLTARLAGGEGLYTYNECAALVGLKPTANFKRRVRQMVEQGLLAKHITYTERGGLEFRFGSTEAGYTGSIPF